MQDQQVEVVPGSHAVARVAGAVVLVAYRGAGRPTADSPAVRALVALAELVYEATARHPEGPGAAIARDATRWLTASAAKAGPGGAADFGILSAAGPDRVAIFLHGAVTAVVAGETTEYFHGRDAAFTVDRTTSVPSRAVALYVDDPLADPDDDAVRPELPAARGIGRLVEGIAEAGGAIAWTPTVHRVAASAEPSRGSGVVLGKGAVRGVREQSAEPLVAPDVVQIPAAGAAAANVPVGAAGSSGSTTGDPEIDGVPEPAVENTAGPAHAPRVRSASGTAVESSGVAQRGPEAEGGAGRSGNDGQGPGTRDTPAASENAAAAAGGAGAGESHAGTARGGPGVGDAQAGASRGGPGARGPGASVPQGGPVAEPGKARGAAGDGFGAGDPPPVVAGAGGPAVAEGTGSLASGGSEDETATRRSGDGDAPVSRRDPDDRTAATPNPPVDSGQLSERPTVASTVDRVGDREGGQPAATDPHHAPTEISGRQPPRASRPGEGLDETADSRPSWAGSARRPPEHPTPRMDIPVPQSGPGERQRQGPPERGAPPLDAELRRRTEATAKGAALTVKVRGFKCARAHPTDPRSAFCSVCGMPVDQTQPLIEVMRPPLGILVLDDGSTYLLETDSVLGRDPENSEPARRGLTPLQVTDNSGGMSRAHAELLLVEWDVTLVDRGSTNGTRTRAPGFREWARVPPHQPVVLVPGTEILIGNRMLRFESAAPPPFGS
ncbi:FHA domain-containing protein [Nocardia carnea]|uniref:FHA domain-containing protein n=1 Tax=Nocardia carnea TaxID=37328 RepID=UPI002456C1A5|nr:FHA domain-containing protein [Nocardia carnea]